MLAIIGESGSGKSTLEKELVGRYGYNKITCYTTRKIRINEVDGREYHFRTKHEFEQMLKDGILVEYVTYNNEYYGIARQDCTDDKVVIVELEGLRQLMSIPSLNVTSVYLRASEETRTNRMLNRYDSFGSVNNRILNDRAAFIGAENLADYTLINEGTKNELVNNLLALLEIEQQKVNN